MSPDTLEIFSCCVFLVMFQFVLQIFGWGIGHRS